MDYTTIEKVQSHLNTIFTGAFITYVEGLITSVSKHIDERTHRVFEKKENITLKFDGYGQKRLFVPDLLTVTSLKVEETVITDAYYFLYTKSPYQWIERADEEEWPKGQQNIEIIGDWGYGEIPTDIELAATLLVAAILRESNLKESKQVASETIGEYKIAFNFNKIEAKSPLVIEILEHYTRAELMSF